MSTGRMEAFSDGVIAIIITIMVLELTVPHETDLAALRGVVPIFLSYVLSFIYVGIYWNNHHHLLRVVQRIDGRALWANLHLLFWLSLVPFGSAWLGENNFAAWPAALYGAILTFAAIAYFILTKALIAANGGDSVLATAIGHDFKGKISIVLYLVAIPLAFINEWLACAIYVLVAIMWLVPDRRLANSQNLDE